MVSSFVLSFLLRLRKGIYFFYSNNAPKSGNCKSYQPVVMRGKGQIHFGKKVIFGILNSPHLHSSYIYIEARSPQATISFGNNVNINNGFSVISEKNIVIKDNVLIGYNCTITDSNFHDLNVDKRNEKDPEPKEVIIENNVFIGNNVSILKGVKLGENTVVGTGSIVTKSFPKNVVIAGCPAKLIRNLV